MSTPFDLEAVDELDPHVARHKIASFDLTNRELLEAVAATGKPLVVSTGHAYLGEVETALGWICAVEPSADVTLLHCTSQYPTAASDVHLRAMETMRSAFGYPVGLSDHTIGNAISLAAVALGAVMLERHVTEDVASDGPDHHFALEPDVLSALVRDAESVRAALGSAVKAPTSSELENRQLARRSIHVARDLTAGHELSRDDLTVVRPALGIEPADLHLVVGRRLVRDLAAGSPLQWSDV
jgi:sialic acid synthase SpsE